MKKKTMLDFFKRLGHEVIQTKTSDWYNVQPNVFLSIPYNKLISPDNDEISTLAKTVHARVLRFPTGLDSYGFLSTITINTQSNYNFCHLHQKSRNQTRRGLEECEVKQIDFDKLKTEGLPLNIDTSLRQGRESQYDSKGYWDRYCQAASQTEGVYAFGSYYKNQLASFLIAIETSNNWVEWVINHSSTKFRNVYANNALVFKTGQFFLNERKVDGICYGLGSLEQTDSLNHFKERMGWDVRPIKQRLVFSNRLHLLARCSPNWALTTANKIFPRSYTVRKASAMLKLYNKQESDSQGMTYG